MKFKKRYIDKPQIRFKKKTISKVELENDNNIREIKVNEIKVNEIKVNEIKVNENFSNQIEEQIVRSFDENVRYKQFDGIKKHCGSEGHWLEHQMGIDPNGKNVADLFGYEMKKESKKITFGDYSASEYLFSKKKLYIDQINNNSINISRDKYLEYFGTYKSDKNRYSWSGTCCPRYVDKITETGQIIKINDNDDICIYYSFDDDKRDIKHTFEDFLKKNNILIAYWKNDKIRRHINNKFNDKGFFIVSKNKDNVYDRINFGLPFTFDEFILNFKKGLIFFDSGMYQGNTRAYSMFRANSDFWNSLIVRTY